MSRPVRAKQDSVSKRKEGREEHRKGGREEGYTPRLSSHVARDISIHKKLKAGTS